MSSLSLSHFRLEASRHVELVIPQNAGSVLIFTPPGTPRRGSLPTVDPTRIPNGHAAGPEQQTVASEIHLATTPKDFDMVELSIPSPFVNGEAPDLKKEAALQRMNDVADKLIESEENYVNELNSLAEVWNYKIIRVTVDGTLPFTTAFLLVTLRVTFV